VDWLGPALVLYVAVAAVLVARRRVTQIARLRILDAAALSKTIKAGSDDELAAVAGRVPGESFEGLIVSAILEDAAPDVRIATVNEHLGDLDRELESQRDIPKVIARGALLCGTFGCVLQLSLTVAGPLGPAWTPAATSFLLGLFGFAASLQIDRRARELAALVRAEWDRVALALGERIGRGPETRD
jgi:hypothetical protein